MLNGPLEYLKDISFAEGMQDGGLDLIFPDQIVKELTGGSSMKTFLVKNYETGLSVIKYSDWGGVDGNGQPFLNDQVEALKRLEKQFPKLGDLLFPKVLNYVENPDYSYYRMPYYEGITLNNLLLQGGPGKLAFLKLKNIMKCMFQEIYPAKKLKRSESVINKCYLNRMEKRVEVLYKRDGDFFERIIEKCNGVNETRWVDLIKDIMDAKKVIINGEWCPNFNYLIKKIRLKKEVLNSLEPYFLVDFYHGDLTLGNIYCEYNGNCRLLDGRLFQGGGDVIYDLSKLSFSFYYELIINKCIGLSVKNVDGIYYVDLNYKSDNNVKNLLKLRRELIEFYKKDKYLNKLLKKDKLWLKRLYLAEVSHFISAAPTRLESDPSGFQTLALYLFGIKRFSNLMEKEGFL